MASRKGFLANYTFGGTTSDTHLESNSREGDSELDEAEVWNFYTDATNPVTVTEASKGSGLGMNRGSSVCGSLPVNIPEWSNILKEDYGENRKRESDEDGRIRIPPHEYLARTRGAPFSVQEGIGRTLKGRDLRSLRNAIWKKVGFED